MDGTKALAKITTSETNPALLYLLTLTTKVSRDAQRCALNDFTAFASQGTTIATFPWADVRPEHLLLYRDALLLRLKPNTVNRYLAAVRGVVKMAWVRGVIDAETLARVREVGAVPTETLPGGRDLEDEVLKAIVEHTQKQRWHWLRVRDRAILTLFYASGMRRAELAGLELDDVVVSAGGILIRARGKGHKEREIPVSARFVEPVQAWLKVRGTEPGPFFTAQHSLRALGPDAVARMVRTMAKRAGVGRVTPHDFRRTCAGRLLDAGADLSAVSKLLGHKKPSTTVRYDCRGKRAVIAAADKLPAF